MISRQPVDDGRIPDGLAVRRAGDIMRQRHHPERACRRHKHFKHRHLLSPSVTASADVMKPDVEPVANYRQHQRALVGHQRISPLISDQLRMCGALKSNIE
jgi:hypothetical protein